ncbi:MAG: hypothetical protein HY906_21460 [Deltaproteobacteria bacterium]|nr:hypothetical protein [Deltaproteobacteria bacterium]
MRAFVVVLGAALVTALGGGPGCSCSQRDTLAGAGDGGVGDAAGRDGAPADARVPDGARDGGRDGGTGTCARAGAWYLEPRPIAGIELVPGPPPRVGVTEQVLVTVGLNHACEELAWVKVEIMPGDATDFVGLRAAAWTLPYVPDDERCKPPGPALATTVVTVPGRGQGNFMVGVTDLNYPNGAGLGYGRQGCPGGRDCPCYGGLPAGTAGDGDACVTDCSCAAGLACLGSHDFDGRAQWTCQKPCADTRECDFTWICISYVSNGASFVCRHCYEYECETAADCPAGFSCHEAACGQYCEDERSWPASTWCDCDAECPAGERCTSFGEAPSSCQQWCRTDADCPQPSGVPLYCSMWSICLPPEMARPSPEE